MKKFVESIIYATDLSILSGIMMISIVLVVKFLGIKGIIAEMTFPTIISVFLLPYFINKRSKEYFELNLKKDEFFLFVWSFLVVAIAILFQFKNFELVLLCLHYFIAGFSEEYLYRGIILNRLEKDII